MKLLILMLFVLTTSCKVTEPTTPNHKFEVLKDQKQGLKQEPIPSRIK